MAAYLEERHFKMNDRSNKSIARIYSYHYNFMLYTNAFYFFCI